MPCNLDGKLGFCIVCPPIMLYVLKHTGISLMRVICMYQNKCIMQVYFLLKIVLHCFFCLINWDPKVHRIDASHSHKS